MLRSRLLPVVLAGLLVPGLSLADDPKTPQEKLEAQQKQIDEKLTKLLAEIAGMKERIQAIERTLKSHDLSETNYMVVELGQKFDTLLREMRQTQKPSSDYARMPGTSESKKTGSGTFRIINDYTIQRQIMVNGSRYVVDPGQRVDVPVPAGSFSFQILDHHDTVQNRVVEANKVFQLRMHP